MWKGGSQNSDSHLDDHTNRWYSVLFHEADQMTYRFQGVPFPEYQGVPFPEYHTHNDSSLHGDSSRSATCLGESSCSGLTSDEALARLFQDIEIGYYTFSSHEQPSRTGAIGDDEDDVNLDEMTNEITELEQSSGTIKEGLSEEQMSRLPTHKYRGSSSKKKDTSADDDSECVICKMQYDKGDVLMTLPCAHKYHEDCIRKWLTEDKSCCVCKEEVAI